MRVSLCCDACVLMLSYVCPYAIIRVSLCSYPYALMVLKVCPYAFHMCPYGYMIVSLCYHACVLMHTMCRIEGIPKVAGWRYHGLVELCSGKTLHFTVQGVTEDQHQANIPPVFEVSMMHVCVSFVSVHVSLRCYTYVLMFACVRPHAIMRVSLCHHVCVLMLLCLCPYFFKTCVLILG